MSITNIGNRREVLWDDFLIDKERTTATQVLNHPEKVKPATREKIEKIIKELGYKPNLNAKGLASSRSTTVAVVVPRLNRSSVAEMVNGIADCAERRGYLLRLFINKSQPTDEEALVIEKETLGNVFASGVDGVLYVSRAGGASGWGTIITHMEKINANNDARFKSNHINNYSKY